MYRTNVFSLGNCKPYFENVHYCKIDFQCINSLMLPATVFACMTTYLLTHVPHELLLALSCFLFCVQFQVEHHRTALTAHSMHGMLGCSGRSQCGHCRMDRFRDTTSNVTMIIPVPVSQLISALRRLHLLPVSPLFQWAHSLSTLASCLPSMKWEKGHQHSAPSLLNKMVTGDVCSFMLIIYFICYSPRRSSRKPNEWSKDPQCHIWVDATLLS